MCGVIETGQLITFVHPAKGASVRAIRPVPDRLSWRALRCLRSSARLSSVLRLFALLLSPAMSHSHELESPHCLMPSIGGVVLDWKLLLCNPQMLYGTATYMTDDCQTAAGRLCSLGSSRAGILGSFCMT